MFAWIHLLFKKEKLPVELEKSVAPIPEIIQEQKDPLLGAFLHTQKRIKERYNFNIDRNTYDNWVMYIKTKSKKFTFVHTRANGSRLYMTYFKNKKIFLVYDNEVIKTALPYKLEWVQQAVANKPKTGKASKNVGRGNLK